MRAGVQVSGVRDCSFAVEDKQKERVAKNQNEMKPIPQNQNRNSRDRAAHHIYPHYLELFTSLFTHIYLRIFTSSKFVQKCNANSNKKSIDPFFESPIQIRSLFFILVFMRHLPCACIVFVCVCGHLRYTSDPRNSIVGIIHRL